MDADRVKDHFDEEAPRYDDLIVRLIPGYREQHDVILGILPFDRESPLRVLDLGCGTGALSRLVLDAYPNARVEATDLATGMLAECAANLAGFGHRVSYRELDFGSGDLGSGYGLVLAGLSVHHIDDEAKRDLFRRVFDALRPGGMFVMREIVTADTPGQTEADRERWRAFMDESGEDGRRWYEQSLGEDHPASLTDQLEWLRDAGFAQVAAPWRRINFAVFGGVRP
jgi:tRNA (cmo5U34)-methyltransferase